MTLRLGIMLPQLGNYDQATDIADAARIAEATGYDSVWAFERFLYPRDQSGVHGFSRIPGRPWPRMHAGVADPLITLTTAAAVTSTIQVGTSVLVPGLHLPGRLAKTLAGLDAASAGRLIAGLGNGWSVDEFAATGPRPFDERGDALDEFLEIADAVWSADPVTFENDRYAITRADVGPKPARTIPVAIGGNGPLALARVARRGDAWMPIALPPERFSHSWLRSARARSQQAATRQASDASSKW
ncbi:TIGR03619 family F420-dependent LLM class oxidoreductase [Actinoplanes sp. NPDC051475]|uniref:TIGR03619 family F420-dependent LLM class oxidoreductase n=1 Tax=Actinoplanes sp. NPDC051475 TaxID=3157225 RepID=UPI00344CCE09